MKKALFVLSGVVFSFVLLFIAINWHLASPPYKGPVSDHFDGRQFFNQGGVKLRSFWDLLTFLRTRAPGPWSNGIKPRPAKISPTYESGELHITWVNHSTVLIQVGDFNILTDPIWSERASPVSFAGPKRVIEPRIDFDALPHVHAVIISHNHYDHMDIPTLKKLARKFNPTFFAGLGNAAYLKSKGIGQAKDLDWWDSVSISSGLKITLAPAQHFSGRSLFDQNKTLWAGFVIESPTHKLFFAGDTGFGPHFEQVYDRFGPMDVALLPIGAFVPEWFMGPVHISPAEAVKAAKALRAKVSIPIHFGTFKLADDGETEPLEKLAQALAKESERPKFIVNF